MPDCGCNHFPASGGNVTFDPGVQVGIGTASPATLLNVVGAGAYPTFLFQGSDPASGVNGLAMVADGRGYTLFVGGSQNAGMPNTFGLFDSTASAFRLVVTPSGNVGIGTQSPGARLQVAGAASTVTLLVQPADNTDAVRVTPNADGQTSAAFGVTNAAGSVVTGAILKNGAAQLSGSLTLTRVDTGASYTKLLVDQNDLHLTSSATSDGTPSGTRGTISLQTNPYGDGILQVGAAPGTGAFLVYQVGQQVLGGGRQQFGVYSVDSNGVDYPYLTLDASGLHLAATNPGYHGSTISLNTNVYGDAILSVGTGPGVGTLIVQQSGTQLMVVGSGGNLTLAGRTVANGNGCFYA